MQRTCDDDVYHSLFEYVPTIYRDLAVANGRFWVSKCAENRNGHQGSRLLPGAVFSTGRDGDNALR